MVGTGISLNNMRPPLPNVTWHSGDWPYTVTSSIDQPLHQFWTLLLISTLLPNSTFYLIVRASIGCGMPTEDAHSSGHLILSIFWTCTFLMLRPISPELVLFPDFWASNIPRYLCFASMQSFNGSPVNRTGLAKTRHSLLILWGGGGGFWPVRQQMQHIVLKYTLLGTLGLLFERRLTFKSTKYFSG